jgi:hypothetical protein
MTPEAAATEASNRIFNQRYKYSDTPQGTFMLSVDPTTGRFMLAEAEFAVREKLRTLSVGDIRIPEVALRPNQTKEEFAEEYLKTVRRGKFVNEPGVSDGLVLIDPFRNPVRDKNGRLITIPFKSLSDYTKPVQDEAQANRSMIPGDGPGRYGPSRVDVWTGSMPRPAPKPSGPATKPDLYDADRYMETVPKPGPQQPAELVRRRGG